MSKKNIFRGLLCAQAAVLIFCSISVGKQSGAELLVQRLPDETIGFIATSGCDELKPAFDKTILGRMWNDPNVQTFVNSIKSEIIARIKIEIKDPNEAKTFDEVVKTIRILNRPIVVGAAIDKSINEGPPIYGFAIVDVGTKKAEFSAAVSRIEGLSPKDEIKEVTVGGMMMHWFSESDDVPGYWGFAGNYFIFAVNDKSGLAMKRLSGGAAGVNYLSDVSGNGDALVFYTDFQKIAAIVQAISAQEKDEKGITLISSVMKSLGIADVMAAKSRTGFSGQDFVSDELVEIPQPRTGIPSMLKPVDISIFDFADAQSMDAAAWNIDAGGIYDTMMNTIKVASPNDLYPAAMKGLAELEKNIGINIRKDLVGSLSGPMIVYTAAQDTMSTIPVGGVVLVAKTANAQGLEQALTKLCNLAVESSEKKVQVNSMQQDGRTFYTIAALPYAAMQILPTWTIADGYLVAAINQQLCIKAAARLTAANRSKDSLRTTAGFKKATAGIPKEILYLDYIDSSVEFGQSLKVAQQYWPTLSLMAAGAGLKLPLMMPSLDYLAGQMGPTVQYCYYDSRGLHSKYRGSGLEASITTVIAGGAVGAAILMPALAKARQQAQRIVSANHIRNILLGLIMYADAHDNKLPASINEELMKNMGIDSKEKFQEMLESPQKPKNFNGPSYIYVPIEKMDMKGADKIIILYENPEFCTDGVNVGFLDGHVEFMKPESFKKALESSYKLIGKPMPEIKFAK